MPRKTTRILVADDDASYRELAADELQKAGITAILAADGQAASRLLAREAFDAAIIDIDMPHEDGIEVIRRMRAAGPNARTPAIVITGHDDEGAVARAYDAGATSFLTKPLNWLLFSPHLSFVLRSAQTEADLREAHATAAFLSDIKSRVLSTLANDFQGPIKSIFGFSQLISKEAYGPIAPAPYREMAHDITNAAHRLNASLLRILDFGRSLSDHLQICDEVFAARLSVLDAIGASEAKAQRRDITIDVDLDLPGELTLRADRALFNHAIRGVLDDAIRLSPRGGRVVVRAGVDDTGEFWISTVDQGPPASAELIAEINGGDGGGAPALAAAWPVESRDVGVRIARVLTEAHNGEMEIAARPGEPNVVRLSLPSFRVADTAASSDNSADRTVGAARSKFAEIAAEIAAGLASR